jgi:hypothetical protein
MKPYGGAIEAWVGSPKNNRRDLLERVGLI